MSPASRSKSKDKKASKEAQKASAKTSGSGNAGNGIPASAYNPLSGTFHTLEMSPMSSASPIHSNGRFQNIDEPDEQPGGLLVGGTEFDSVSNNGSWSGESEDHKDKTLNPPVRLEALPGADNDKREKIRLKNERKHQRQKERRAQELHERCNGYLMSRRLEALAQQLVAMGFSHEQATMALIMNEGRVEESVAWLFEGGEDTYKQMDKNISEGNLKIDISEELARIADMETRYQCSRQEVERAIVSSEGDLEKAAETLRELKHDPPTAPPKLEETGDPLAVSNGKQSAIIQNPRPQTKTNLPPNQLKKDDKDFNYTKSAVMLGGTAESVNKNMQPLKRIQPKLDWAKHQQVTISADKRWPSAGSNPSVSYSLSSSLQVTPPPAKTETYYIAHGGEYGKNFQPAAVREPVTMMQRPQSINVKQIPASSMSSSPPGMVASWYPTNGVDVIKSNGFLPQISSTRSLGPNCMNSNQMYHRLQYQPQQQLVSGSSSMDSQATSRGNGLWNRTGVSPTVAAASSLGLFSALGSPGTSGASSPVDWTTGGSMLHLDYTSIDWSLDRGLSSGSPNGFHLGLPSFPKNNHRMYDLSTAAGEGAQPSLRSLPSNGNMLGLQDGRVATTEASVAGSREWSSPFEEKDLFSLPRQFVSSPSL